MKEIVLIIRPEKLEVLKSILDEKKCGGMTISTVMGCGAQKGAVEGVNEIINWIKKDVLFEGIE